MSQENGYTDPREKFGFEIEVGMVFKDTRYDEPREIAIDYADRRGGVRFIDMEGDADRDKVYLMDSYDTFESNVGAGRYKPVRNEDGEIVRKGWMGQIHRLKEQYEDSSRKEKHKAEAIQEVLDIITDDVPEDHNDTIPLDDIDGVGSKAAQALMNAGFTTKGDVRNASREKIEDVSYMGSKNTDALLDYVNQ